jgi:hypothetical protein
MPVVCRSQQLPVANQLAEQAQNVGPVLRAWEIKPREGNEIWDIVVANEGMAATQSRLWLVPR